MKRAFPILAMLTAALLGFGFYQAMWVAPTDQLQGDIYRIIYYHVPSGWSMFVFFAMNFVASIIYLIRRNLKADAVAVSAAEIGLVFCTVVLVTGPIWARPVWGIWWTWDWRLTSTLVMWLIYVSYLVLRRFSSEGQPQVLAAALAIFGGLDIPLVYFSIWFFRTQHPQPVMGDGGSMDPGMFHVLLINLAAFLCFGFLVFWARYRMEGMRQAVEETEALLESTSSR